MIDVTVKVPESRVPEFYGMVAEWLKAQSTRTDEELKKYAHARTPALPRTPESTRTDEELKKWGPDDLDQAIHVWAKMSPQARELFVLIPAGPDNTVGWAELAKLLPPGADHTTVGGTFGWPARFAREVGRTKPTKRTRTERGPVYWLEPTVKDLFDKARARFNKTSTG